MLSTFRRIEKLMGNRFEISIVAEDKEWAGQQIEKAIKEVQRIEALLTTFKSNSQTNMVNEQAGIKPVQVDQEVYDLVSRSLKISQITQGAFDITYGSVDKSLWNFDTHLDHLPDEATLKKTVRLINFKNVLLDPEKRTIFLKEKGMRIGFGGIGKGYAADKVKILLLQNGVQSGVVNAAGDLNAWGVQPDGKPWTVGIADPNSKLQAFSYLNISNRAVATSGNYEKFALINGKRYSHTIDPKTGKPVSGIKSVTIIAPTAELADALATPVMVMGLKTGISLIDQMKGLACIVIDENDLMYTSHNISTR